MMQPTAVSKQRHARRRVTFRYMGCYWSMRRDHFRVLQAVIEAGQPFDLEDFNVRQLKRKPLMLDWERIA